MVLEHKYSDQLAQLERPQKTQTVQHLCCRNYAFLIGPLAPPRKEKQFPRLPVGPISLNPKHSALKTRGEVLKFKPLISTKWEQLIIVSQ